jgi:hypothetical protein
MLEATSVILPELVTEVETWMVRGVVGGEEVVVVVVELIGELCDWDVRWSGVGQGVEDGDGELCDGKLMWVGTVFY